MTEPRHYRRPVPGHSLTAHNEACYWRERALEAEGERDELLKAAKLGVAYVKSAESISVFAIDARRKIEEAIDKAEGDHQ